MLAARGERKEGFPFVATVSGGVDRMVKGTGQDDGYGVVSDEPSP